MSETTSKTKTVRRTQYFQEKNRLIVVVSDLTRNLADIEAGFGVCEFKFGAAIHQYCSEDDDYSLIFDDVHRSFMPQKLVEELIKRLDGNKPKIIVKDLKAKLRRTATGRLEKAPVVLESRWCFLDNEERMTSGENNLFVLGSRNNGQKIRSLVARHGVRGKRLGRSNMCQKNDKKSTSPRACICTHH